MASPASSVYMVLSIGALCGGIVKGITGFGNAIINLLVWVTFNAAGVDGGPLRLAVLADSIGCVVCSIPLLCMTSAHKTSDWSLVITILLFTTAGAPVGAALLIYMNARWVELVMAFVLLLVICLHVKPYERIQRIYQSYRAKYKPAATGFEDQDDEEGGRRCRQTVCNPFSLYDPTPRSYVKPATGPDASLRCVAVDCLPSPIPNRHLSEAGMHSPPCENAERLLPGYSCSEMDTCSDPSTPPAPIANYHMVEDETTATTPSDAMPVMSVAAAALTPDPSMQAGPTKSTEAGATQCLLGATATVHLVEARDDSNKEVVPGQSRLSVDSAEVAGNKSDSGVTPATECDDGRHNDTRPVLDNDNVASDALPTTFIKCDKCRRASVDDVSKEGFTDTPDASLANCHCCALGCGSRKACGVCTRLQRWLAAQDWQKIRRTLLVGSFAGFASGVMGGMTGIGGPPIMYMYEKLQVAKEVVRGTNAVNNVLQVRLVSYIILGVFERQEVALYAVTSIVGLVGVFAGNSLAGRMQQKGFSRILVALMIVCCILLFVSAAGIRHHAN